MDFSKEYIKMCEKAEGIQKIRNAQTGDFYFDRINCIAENYSKDKIFLLHNLNTCDEYGITSFIRERDPGRFVWLPRQDQLQELYAEKQGSINLVEKFYRFCYEREIPLVNSFEILWLLFVMKGLFNKIWDGEEWEKN